MNVIWNINPLRSETVLTDSEKELFYWKHRCDQLELKMKIIRHHLMLHNLQTVKFYCDSELDYKNSSDMCVANLTSSHHGDCNHHLFPCGKCLSEEYTGINTIEDFSKDDLKIYFDIGSLTDKEDMLENITNLSYPKDIIKHARVALLEYWARKGI